MCELVDVIGETGIAYCTIPLCDRGNDCKTCAVYKKDALIALAEEIITLQKKVKKLENHIHHQDVYQAGSTGEPVFNTKDNG